MLVAGQGLVRIGIVDEVIRLFQAGQIDHVVFDCLTKSSRIRYLGEPYKVARIGRALGQETRGLSVWQTAEKANVRLIWEKQGSADDAKVQSISE